MSLITDWIAVTASNDSDFVRAYSAFGRLHLQSNEYTHALTHACITVSLLIFVRMKCQKYPHFGYRIAQLRNIRPSLERELTKNRESYTLSTREVRNHSGIKIIQYFFANRLKGLIIAGLIIAGFIQCKKINFSLLRVYAKTKITWVQLISDEYLRIHFESLTSSFSQSQ